MQYCRWDMLNYIIKLYDYKSYLEIGLRHPWEWVEFFEESQNTNDWGLSNTEIEYEIY